MDWITPLASGTIEKITEIEFARHDGLESPKGDFSGL
jgi:hypothetical protein